MAAYTLGREQVGELIRFYGQSISKELYYQSKTIRVSHDIIAFFVEANGTRKGVLFQAMEFVKFRIQNFKWVAFCQEMADSVAKSVEAAGIFESGCCRLYQFDVVTQITISTEYFAKLTQRAKLEFRIVDFTLSTPFPIRFSPQDTSAYSARFGRHLVKLFRDENFTSEITKVEQITLYFFVQDHDEINVEITVDSKSDQRITSTNLNCINQALKAIDLRAAIEADAWFPLSIGYEITTVTCDRVFHGIISPHATGHDIGPFIFLSHQK